MSSMDQKFRIGMVGYGVGKLLSWSYRNIPRYYKDISDDQIELYGVCTAHDESGKKAQKELGFIFRTSDFGELVNHPEINIITVSVPDYLHAPVVMDAIKAGKHVFCEKPLAVNIQEARDIYTAAHDAGIVHHMGFQMRNSLAAIEAKKIIEGGLLGDIFTYRCTYQHSGYEEASRPMSWRLDKTKAGGGALYDLGSHAIDLCRYILGEYKSLTARQKTYIKERPASKGSDKLLPVEVDDTSFILAEMENGVLGSIEATRLATGIRRGPELTVHGTQGSLQFNSYIDPHILHVHIKKQQKVEGQSGFEDLILSNSPVPLEVACLYDFLKDIQKGQAGTPNFQDGVKTQEVLEAVKASSLSGEWINL